MFSNRSPSSLQQSFWASKWERNIMASMAAHIEEKCSWEADARRVVGLHLVNIVIWVLKLLPLLPMEGCWYLRSEPRKRCNIHLRHLRLISACTCTSQPNRLRADRAYKEALMAKFSNKKLFSCLTVLTSPFRKQYSTATTNPYKRHRRNSINCGESPQWTAGEALQIFAHE